MFLPDRTIDDLRGLHPGEAWIVGSGESLDDLPDDFLDGKTSIVLNWSILAYPNPTYWHGHHEDLRDYLMAHRYDLLTRCIMCYPFVGPFKAGRITDPVEYMGDLSSLPIWMRYANRNPAQRCHFEACVRAILAGSKDIAYEAAWTVAHTGIEAAVMMGASKITLVGCEHRGGYAKKITQVRKQLGMSPGHAVHPMTWLDKRFNGTAILADILAQHGIVVERFDGAYHSIL